MLTRALQKPNITRIECEKEHHYCCKEKKEVTTADKNPQPFPTARPSTTTTEKLPDGAHHSKLFC